MSNYINFTFRIIIALYLLTVTSCIDRYDVLTPLDRQSIAQNIIKDDQFSFLETALRRINLMDSLQRGQFTLFAPTNTAFQQAGYSNQEAIEQEEVSVLEDILLVHLLNVPREASSFNNNEVLISLNNQNLTVTVASPNFAVNGTLLTATDRRASNGIVHIVDEFIPSSNTNTRLPSTVSEALAKDPNFSLLNFALKRTSIDQIISSVNEKYTIFAPTNSAFKSIQLSTEQALEAMAVDDLRELINRHIIIGDETLANLQNGIIYTNFNNKTIVIGKKGNSITINGSAVSFADIKTINGTIHAVSDIVGLKNSILDYLFSNPKFSLLSVAIKNISKNSDTNLADLLVRSNKFGNTFIAPTNTAFLAANISGNSLNEAYLSNPNNALFCKNILTYHLISILFQEADIPQSPDQPVSTLDNFRKIHFTKSSYGTFANNTQLQEPILQDNGIVYTTNKILEAPDKNIIEILNELGATLFIRAIEVAEARASGNYLALMRQYYLPGSYTVFAPTNQAMLNAFDANGNGNIEDGEFLTPFTGFRYDFLAEYVLFHTVTNRYFTFNLPNGNLPTLSGGYPLIFTTNGTNATVEGSTNNVVSIVSSNHLANNGVVHLVDEFIY